MDKHVQQELNELLEHLDAQENTTASQSHGDQQGTEVIDVFIVRRQVEEPELTTVEGTLANPCAGQETQATFAEQEKPQHPLSPLARKPHRRALPFLIGALCILLVVALGGVVLPLTFTPAATVTIIPISMQITTTKVVTIVSSNANTAQQQVPGRRLDAMTFTQAKIVPATGTAQQPAQAARGFITFYNALPAVQTIPAGELLTGADGVEVVTLQSAVIPAGTLASNGQVTVPAQAANAGPQGNIAVNDIYGKCCRDDVFVSNGLFHGGYDARSYQVVTQQNINQAVFSLKTSLDQSIQAALSRQVQFHETLVGPVPCATLVVTDHKAGEEASHVQVTVRETCRGEAYDTKMLHDLLIQTVTQQATGRLGDGYGLVGDIQASVVRATQDPQQGTAILQVKITSAWTCQFSQARQAQIRLAIRGKTKEEATSLLQHMPGIQTVLISTGNSAAVPTDVQYIHLNFVVLT